jgi:hypothetical protein
MRSIPPFSPSHSGRPRKNAQHSALFTRGQREAAKKCAAFRPFDPRTAESRRGSMRVHERIVFERMGAQSNPSPPPHVAVEQRGCSRERHMHCEKQLPDHTEASDSSDFGNLASDCCTACQLFEVVLSPSGLLESPPGASPYRRASHVCGCKIALWPNVREQTEPPALFARS